MRLGIFGGTFDPIHRGHLEVAKAAKAQFHLDKVLFVPNLIPPHKTYRRDITPAPYRFKMVELAIQNEPGFEACDLEFNRPDISFTVDTLQELQRLYPKAQLFLIIGEDSFEEMNQWKDPEQIKKMAKLLIAPRNGGKAVRLAKDEAASAIDMKIFPVSSTRLRETLQSGALVKEDVIPAAVYEYIRRMNLYGEKR